LGILQSAATSERMAGALMISEIEFTRDYTSFWRTLSPLSEDLVRQVNIHVLNRYESALESIAASSRRALINEVAFEIFSQSKTSNIDPAVIISNQIDTISKKISSYIAGLRSGAPHFNKEMSAAEINEAQSIAERLLHFFSSFKKVIIRPKFSGCGRLNSCQGDVLADNTLYEIKAGGRRFKSVDLRQLVLYLALNHQSKQYTIQNLGLYNPREGFLFTLPHEEFSLQFSGLSTEELCHRIAYELSVVDFGRFDPLI